MCNPETPSCTEGCGNPQPLTTASYRCGGLLTRYNAITKNGLVLSKCLNIIRKSHFRMCYLAVVGNLCNCVKVLVFLAFAQVHKLSPTYYLSVLSKALVCRSVRMASITHTDTANPQRLLTSTKIKKQNPRKRYKRKIKNG